MSNPLLQLRRILQQSQARTGRVITVTGTSATVATSSGVIQAEVAGGLVIAVDDRVKLEGNLIIGKLRNIATLPKYEV